jgi:transketolase
MNIKISTREAYGRALCEAGSDERIVALEADLAICTMSIYFKEKYPSRFFDLGIAEANMVDMAAGFATTGKIPFCHSFAMFTAGRCFEQIRNSVAYPNLNVKIIGSHAGLTVGRDGATHQCLEDLGIMRTIPNMLILAPCDANETQAAVKALIAYEGPAYMRTCRIPVEEVTSSFPSYNFELGKGIKLKDGNDVALCATGIMVQPTVKAAEILEKSGVHARVIDMPTIKPVDEDLILKAAQETGLLITVEEHNVIGGLGSAVCETVSSKYPVPVERIGVMDRFGMSGDADELLDYFGLTTDNIVKKVYTALQSFKKNYF